MNNTLYLKYKKSDSPIHRNGLWVPEDHLSQEIALKHFSIGSIAIDYGRLDEIVYVASLHGWKVETEGDPKEG